MKSTLASVFLVATILSLGIGFVSVAQTGAPKHEPNSGYVSDADAAKEVAKIVLSRLLTPEDFQRKQFSDAILKDGIWTVKYWEPKIRINSPVAVQIRQQSGAVIKYEDPNA
jgi:hypothetical protein